VSVSPQKKRIEKNTRSKELRSRRTRESFVAEVEEIQNGSSHMPSTQAQLLISMVIEIDQLILALLSSEDELSKLIDNDHAE